jgi:uncharacterized membrane protein YgcG
VRAYSASNEEALLLSDLLKDWLGERFLTEAQYRRMQQETVCELRRTNIFLRLVLFFFTVVIVGGASALLASFFSSSSSAQALGVLLLIFAAVSYAAAELAASRGLYRYGIEEALAICSVALLCAGLYIILSSNGNSPKSDGTEFLIPAIGAIASLAVWMRFGVPYTFLAAMIFVAWLSDCLASSHSAQRMIIAVFYTTGLIIVTRLQSRSNFASLRRQYSTVEALLWLGVYLTFNLQLSSIDPLTNWWVNPRSFFAFPNAFYWATWVLTWCIPAAVLFRGLRRKDRWVIAVGGVVATLTLITNTPYLGWERHTWDPMLLGALLIGVALFVNRWLSKGLEGIRQGFTARRLSGKDKRWTSAVSVAFGLASPHATALHPQPANPDFRFGGGDFGGGGAESDF